MIDRDEPTQRIADWVDRFEYGLVDHHDYMEMWELADD